MFKRMFLAICLAVSVSLSVNAQNEVVNNETILSLLGEGFSTDEIIGLIDMSSERQIEFSINFMRQLKDAGADPELVQYLQRITKIDHGYEGILWWNPSDGGKPRKLYRTTLESESSGGGGKVLAFASHIIKPGMSRGRLFGDIAAGTTSVSLNKIVIQGATARIVLDGPNGSNPVFRFYFPKEEDHSFGEDHPEYLYYTIMAQIESPNEFQCVRMTQKKSKRTFPNGMSYSTMGVSFSKANREVVDFEIKEISNNIFEVSFPDGLEPGEYCFLYKNGFNNKLFLENMFAFDFSVQ